MICVEDEKRNNDTFQMRLGSGFKMRISILNPATTEQMEYILFSFLLMACLLLGGCGLLFGDAAGELRDDGGTKMPAAQGERIPYKLSIEVDGRRQHHREWTRR